MAAEFDDLMGNRQVTGRAKPSEKIILGVKFKGGIEVAAKSAATEPKNAAA